MAPYTPNQKTVQRKPYELDLDGGLVCLEASSRRGARVDRAEHVENHERNEQRTCLLTSRLDHVHLWQA